MWARVVWPAEQEVAVTETRRDPAWRPSAKARVLWSVHALLQWTPLLVAQVVWVLVDSRGVWHVVVAVASAIAVAVHTTVVPVWRYRVHRWEIDDTAVYTRSGWWTQERRIAPISRIQTVDTERGPLEQWLGLATVTVTTASAAGAVKIAALDVDVADRAVAQLTGSAAGHEADAT